MRRVQHLATAGAAATDGATRATAGNHRRAVPRSVGAAGHAGERAQAAGGSSFLICYYFSFFLI